MQTEPVQANPEITTSATPETGENEPTLPCYYLLLLLSWSPIFSLTDDANFGTLERTSRQLRFSLINFGLGPVNLSLISYGFWYKHPTAEPSEVSIKGFSWCKLLRLIEHKHSSEKREQLMDKHAERLNAMDTKKQATEKEILLYKLGQLDGTQARSFNKFLAYLAAVAFIFPLYIPGALKLKSSFNDSEPVTWVYLLFTVSLVYLLLNFFSFLYRFIKVGSFRRFSYGGVSRSEFPEEELINSYYMEYQDKRHESANEVTTIKNLEKYIIRITIVSVALLFFAAIAPSKTDNHKIEVPRNAGYQVVSLDLTKSSKDILGIIENEMSGLRSALLNNEIKKIMLVRHGDSGDENYTRVLQIIRSYNVHNVELAELKDKSDPAGNMQIIYERR
ncbi:hypothetical protein YDYSY3_38520 [Paenibacillus chitinolyticus]|uniref:hypothetical protein n=1 Tax=Paenibacillus chitinolyticus TaxID=79263 RepID=UPI0026E4D647|nr:hypothetical protein [Paenibacillus chitinolyticus]GKS12852.1 hypothetical protein YDYSY3_38520 [Paenibacillus chitinolyticus]